MEWRWTARSVFGGAERNLTARSDLLLVWTGVGRNVAAFGGAALDGAVRRGVCAVQHGVR